MVDWITVEPTQNASITRYGITEEILCKICFKNCMNIILEDEEVDYLIDELSKYKDGKKLVEQICLG